MLNVAVDENELLDLGFGHLSEVIKFPEGFSGPDSLPKKQWQKPMLCPYLDCNTRLAARCLTACI
jgi:hypothetical protein